MKQCSVEGCEGKYYAKGYCHNHYERLRRNGDPTVDKRPASSKDRLCSMEGCNRLCHGRGFCKLHCMQTRPWKVCSVPGCFGQLQALALCSSHYQRFKKYGDPLIKHWPPPRKRNVLPCSIEGCTRPYQRSGLCGPHIDQRTKTEVFDNYGGKCECCGEDHYEFLCIDHINGDGKEDRKYGRLGREMYAFLKKRHYPRENYRLLCVNCNSSLGHWGYCPHQRL